MICLRNRKEFRINSYRFSVAFVRNSNGLFGILCGMNGNLWASRGERSERASAASERAERLTC